MAKRKNGYKLCSVNTCGHGCEEKGQFCDCNINYKTDRLVANTKSEALARHMGAFTQTSTLENMKYVLDQTPLCGVYPQPQVHAHYLPMYNSHLTKIMVPMQAQSKKQKRGEGVQ